MKLRNKGFTFQEIMIVVAIIAIMSVVSVFSYSGIAKKHRLEEARAALMENHDFMTRYYAQNYRYKKNSTTWPDLPVTHTEYFDIAFTSKARAEPADRFRLRASPNARYVSENRYIEIDQSHNIKLCTPKKTVRSAVCVSY
ncbi:MAG: prepilin-type N-terminal cleavage/methylation domain-containing protein [Neisseriaceae bacterium]|nr:prepilin-type N-terminal cleavage/methylation domain-containing protein [Neisseriaceae bacterium]